MGECMICKASDGALYSADEDTTGLNEDRLVPACNCMMYDIILLQGFYCCSAFSVVKKARYGPLWCCRSASYPVYHFVGNHVVDKIRHKRKDWDKFHTQRTV